MADIFYGTDVAVVNDLPLRRNLVSGQANLSRALARRLSTPRGALAAIGGDPNYGYDVRLLLLEAVTPAKVAQWKSEIARECDKDERVQSCAADVQFANNTLTITLSVTTDDDAAPYQAVLSVTALTVTLLEA